MSKHIATHEEQLMLADAPSSFPFSTREALIHKIQAINGSNRREAEMQIDATATEFRKFSDRRPTLHLTSFYRTGTAAS